MIGTAIILAAIIISPEVSMADIKPWVEEAPTWRFAIIIWIVMADLVKTWSHA